MRHTQKESMSGGRGRGMSRLTAEQGARCGTWSLDPLDYDLSWSPTLHPQSPPGHPVNHILKSTYWEFQYAMYCSEIHRDRCVHDEPKTAVCNTVFFPSLYHLQRYCLVSIWSIDRDALGWECPGTLPEPLPPAGSPTHISLHRAQAVGLISKAYAEIVGTRFTTFLHWTPFCVAQWSGGVLSGH